MADVPAFGQADLSNCEREQIHLAGSIQPSGVLLVLREPDHVIVQASANAATLLGVPGDLVGVPLGELPSDLARVIWLHLQGPLERPSGAVRCWIGRPDRLFDALLHRPPSGGVVLELEPAGPAVDISGVVQSGMHAVRAATSLRALCDETARIMREVAGYDRVMVYRFDTEGHGEVLAEERRLDLEAFLGNRYPASDIPQMARRLYERNRVRVMEDVGYTPVPLVPVLSPISGEPLDMSMCFLRSVSPIHVQYLQNMGVVGTLVVSLMVGGRLWGLVACHHYSPRFVHFEVRAVCGLLAEAVATRIAALESFAKGQSELSVRRLEQSLIEAMVRQGDWRQALFNSPQTILQPLAATGAALLVENEVQTIGEVPGTQQLREIGAWLDTQPRQQPLVMGAFGRDVPRFHDLAAVASGVLAVPISECPGEYLVWFRPERIHTVTWGGNPFKPVAIGDDPRDLSPRRSFAQWQQVVEGTCDPWNPADIASARMIGGTVSDVVLQFRAVRTLVAQDQLDLVRRQVGVSAIAVIIADRDGRIMLANDAFRSLLGAGTSIPDRITDLSGLFVDAAQMHRRIEQLVGERRSWRDELLLRPGAGPATPLMIRADPVLVSSDRVLGFVLLFTDVTEQHAAKGARRRFQEGLLAGNAALQGRLLEATDEETGQMFTTLLSSIVENAELAAHEIADGFDTRQIPQLLQAVETSVQNAAEALEHLVRHTDETPARSRRDTPE